MRGKRRGEAKKLSDEDAEERLNKLLVDSGERDRLRERLSKKLDADGWREEVKVGALEEPSLYKIPKMLSRFTKRSRLHEESDFVLSCFQIMVKKIVAENPEISMEDLIQEVSPKATDLVSDRTRREMAEDVRGTLEKAANE